MLRIRWTKLFLFASWGRCEDFYTFHVHIGPKKISAVLGAVCGWIFTLLWPWMRSVTCCSIRSIRERILDFVPSSLPLSCCLSLSLSLPLPPSFLLSFSLSPLSISVSFCLSLSLSVYSSPSLSISLSLSVYFSPSLSLYLTLSVCLFLSLSLSLSLYLTLCLSISLPLSLSFSLSFSLSLYLSHSPQLSFSLYQSFSIPHVFACIFRQSTTTAKTEERTASGSRSLVQTPAV